MVIVYILSIMAAVKTNGITCQEARDLHSSTRKVHCMYNIVILKTTTKMIAFSLHETNLAESSSVNTGVLSSTEVRIDTNASIEQE